MVKIDHMIVIYVTTPHSESAVVAITHENRALLKMASRFAQVEEEEIPQIISNYACTYLRIFYLLDCLVIIIVIVLCFPLFSRAVNSDRILKGLETIGSFFFLQIQALADCTMNCTRPS